MIAYHKLPYMAREQVVEEQLAHHNNQINLLVTTQANERQLLEKISAKKGM